MEKKLAGRGRGGRGRGRGRAVEKDIPGKRSRGRGRGGSKAAPKAKARASKAVKDATAKSGSTSKVAAAAPKKGKGKGKQRGSAESKLPPKLEEPPATPVRATAAKSQPSPPPTHSGGKFVLSARRRSQQKRKETARKALMMLREANLVGLELPKAGFDRQSYTVNPTPDMDARSSIGIVLKSKTFYIADAGKIPRDLAPYAHCDEKLGCTIGFGSYPSLQIALLCCIYICYSTH